MAKNDKKVRIFSALEVANICGVVNQTAINWIKNDYLKAFTTPGGQYRVYAEDLISFLQKRGMRVPDELSEVAQLEEKKKVVIVDDDVTLNNLVKDFLLKRLPTIEVIQAFDGFEAGIKIAENKPGLVILDIDIPGINGQELCKKVKADELLENPEIMAITGLIDPQVESNMLKNGAASFHHKPLDFEVLVDTAKKLLFEG